MRLRSLRRTLELLLSLIWVTSPGTVSAGSCQRWFHLVGEGWWRVGVEGGGGGGPKLKLQALVFDKVLPPTATVSYVIGLQQLTVFSLVLKWQ